MDYRDFPYTPILSLPHLTPHWGDTHAAINETLLVHDYYLQFTGLIIAVCTMGLEKHTVIGI